MVSPINTGGFGVDVLPHFTAPDPSLVAGYNSTPAVQGLLSSLDVAQQKQTLKDKIAQASYLANIRPSEEGATIAGNNLQAGQSTYLQGLGPAQSLAMQKLGPQTTTKQEYNPDTGMMETNTYIPDENGKQKLYKQEAIAQPPQGEVVDTQVGEGGNTKVTKQTYISTIPGQPAVIIDPKTNQEIPNPAASPRLVNTTSQVMPNPRLYGDAQVSQEMLNLQAQLQRATSPTERGFIQNRIQELAAEQKARTDATTAAAAKNTANAGKLATDNPTKVQVAGMNNASRESVAGANNASRESIATGNNASKEKIEQSKEASTSAELLQKDANAWNENEANNATKRYAALARTMSTPGIDEETKADTFAKMQALDKQRQKYEAIQGAQQNGTLNPAGANASVTPGNSAPIPTAYIQYLKAHPESKDSFIQKFGQSAYDQAIKQ
jgi:hypothetical protein